jgi:hypothetical protein
MVKVSIKKHTGLEEARRAIETTSYGDLSSRATLSKVYRWMHSPMRTQLFEISLKDVPSFVATHLVRHVSTQPFVSTRRADRGATEVADRHTLVDMVIWANAEALLSMAGKRLCYQASLETRAAVLEIKKAMVFVDPDLAYNMQPQCVYQGGYCREPKSCGKYKVELYNALKIREEIELV